MRILTCNTQKSCQSMHISEAIWFFCLYFYLKNVIKSPTIFNIDYDSQTHSYHFIIKVMIAYTLEKVVQDCVQKQGIRMRLQSVYPVFVYLHPFSSGAHPGYHEQWGKIRVVFFSDFRYQIHCDSIKVEAFLLKYTIGSLLLSQYYLSFLKRTSIRLWRM
jgi:hypothetical protein